MNLSIKTKDVLFWLFVVVCWMASVAVLVFGLGSLGAQSPVRNVEQPVQSQADADYLQESHEYSTMHDYLDGGRPAKKAYTPRFGLDPIGQAIVRDREKDTDQERRIRLLERQVAQLQRIVFNDPNIRAPEYEGTVPDLLVPDLLNDKINSKAVPDVPR